MPHQNTTSSSGAAQTAATDKTAPDDQAHGPSRSVRPEPRSYAAPDVADSTLAPPAAGEVGDDADEGPPSGGAQQGADRTQRPARTEADRDQGPKTRAANRRIARSGSDGLDR